MSVDWVARAVAGFSSAVALLALVWAVLSWRMSGPSLRIHCLAYREVLVLRIFNSGRTADSIEHVVIGGLKGGRGGIDLTETLGLPERLEPGATKSWRLDPASTPLQSGQRWMVSGWASLWVLTGSMSQGRTEVVPVDEVHPPAVGWRLVPRRAKWARYAPLVIGFPIVIAAASTPRSPAVTWLVLILGVLVAVRGTWVLGTSRSFQRKRAERWVLGLSWLLSIVELGRSSASDPRSGDLPLIDELLIGSYLAVALALAIPGAVPEATGFIRTIASRIGYVMHRISARFSTAPARPSDAQNHVVSASTGGTTRPPACPPER